MIGDLKNFQIDPTLFTGQVKNSVGNTSPPSNPENSKPRLREAAKELESLFFYEMLKELRKTTEGGLLGKGLGSEVYNSLFDMELARLLSGRGVGLKEMIIKQVEGRMGKDISNSLDTIKKGVTSSRNSLEVGRSDIQSPSERTND